jgi:hypothetical protein
VAKETTQSTLNAIAGLIGQEPRIQRRGGTEPKEFLTDIVSALGLPIDPELPKLQLAASIARMGGQIWDRDCDSTKTPSGGGGTITLEGLRRIRNAVRTITEEKPVRPTILEHGGAQNAIHEDGEEYVEESGEYGADTEIVLEDLRISRGVVLRTDAFTSERDSERQRTLLEAAINGHSETLIRLAEAAKRGGATVTQGRGSIDLLATWPDGLMLLAEVKTTPSKLVTRARLGLSQLFEYRFRSGLPSETMLALVLDRPPKGPTWLTSFITGDRNVNLIWWNGMNFEVRGPGASALVERIRDLMRAGH